MNISYRHLYFALLSWLPWMAPAQNVGINTNTPVRSLEIYGNLNQHCLLYTSRCV